MPGKKKKPTSFNWENLLENNAPIQQDPSKKDSHGNTLLQTIANINPLTTHHINKLTDLITPLNTEKKNQLFNKYNTDGLSPLGEALKNHNNSAVSFLRESGADITQCTQNHRWLHHILKYCKESFILEEILGKEQALVVTQRNQEVGDHVSLLHIAAERKNLNIMQRLLSLGVDANASCHPRNHILTQCVEQDLQQVMLFLLPYISTENVHKYNKHGQNALSLTCQKGWLTTMRAIIQQHPATSLSVNEKGENIFHLIAASPSLDIHTVIIDMLMEIGFDVSAQDKAGNNPAMTALLNNNEKLALCLIPHIDLYQLNTQGEHILHIAIYTQATRAAEKILQHHAKITKKNLPTLYKSCPVSKYLRKEVFSKVESHIQKKLPFIEKISPVSLCVLLSAYNTNLINILTLLITSEEAFTAKLEDNPHEIALETGQKPISLVLAKYHVALESIPLPKDISKSAAHPKLSHGVVSPSDIDIYLHYIRETDQLLSEGRLSDAREKSQQIPLNCFPIRWASRYWEQFGDHFLLLCLEHSNSQLGYESLITTIYQGKISPFHILDDYNFQDAPISLRSCIDSFMLWLEKEKVQSRSTTSGKQALKKIGYDFESSEKPHRPTTTPENAVILEKHIPSRDLSSPTSEEYQKTYTEWQKILLQKIDCDPENQKNLEDLPLREIFMHTVNHVLLSALFDEHIHQENCAIQALILVHKSPCKDTRAEIIKKLMRLINPHTQISISWMQRLTQHMNLPIQAQVPLENQLAKSFVAKITENKASEQDLMKIAGLIHNQMIGDRKIQEATRFYQRILEFIITPTGILDELKHLTQWLQLYDNRTQYLYSLNAQHQILYYLADLKDNQYSSIQITKTFEYLAPYLQDKLIPTLPQFPKIVYFLSQPEHLALIPGSSNKLKVHIQSHIAFLSLHIHKHQIGEKNFSTEKSEVQTALENSIQQFQVEKKDLQEELQSLVTTQKKHTQEQKSLTSEISQLNNKLREQHHTHETLLAEQDNLTSQIHAKDQTIDKQATELQKLQQQLSLLQNEKKALQQTIEIYESREVEATQIQKKLDKSVQIIDTEKKKREEAQRSHNQLLQKEKRQIQKHHDEMQKQQQQYHDEMQKQKQEHQTTITQMKNRMETTVEELTEKLSLALRTVEKKHQSTQTITEKKQAIAETEKIRSKNTEKEKAFYIESRSFLNPQEKNLFSKKTSHRGSKELNGYHHMENMQGFFSTPTAFTPMPLPVILETSSSVKEHRFLIHVNRIGQLLAQTPGVHHLNWCGTSAIEFTRSHWKNLDLSHLFRNLREDIDLRVQGSISSQSLQELTTSWPQLKLKNRKTMRYCEKITLELEDNGNKLLFDLQVSSSLPPKQTPDRIEWHWDISQGQWQLNLQSLTPIQQAFLYQTEPYGTSHIEYYSLFWALHQVIKHQELGNTSPTTHILLSHIIAQTDITVLAQAVSECIDHFNDTPYWSSTLTFMIYYPMSLHDQMVAPLINALIPKESSIFGKLLTYNTIDTQAIPDKTYFYKCLKSLWANYEPNTKLLDSTTPINWANITLEPQQPMGLKK